MPTPTAPLCHDTLLIAWHPDGRLAFVQGYHFATQSEAIHTALKQLQTLYPSNWQVGEIGLFSLSDGMELLEDEDEKKPGQTDNVRPLW